MSENPFLRKTSTSNTSSGAPSIWQKIKSMNTQQIPHEKTSPLEERKIENSESSNGNLGSFHRTVSHDMEEAQGKKQEAIEKEKKMRESISKEEDGEMKENKQSGERNVKMKVVWSSGYDFRVVMS